MLKYIKKLYNKWSEPICKSNEGEYFQHCFHNENVKIESCLRGTRDVKHKCCRCGFFKDIHHLYY